MADPYTPPGAQDGPVLRPVSRRARVAAVFLIVGGAWGLLLGLWQSADGRGLQLSLDTVAPFIFFMAAGLMTWRRRASGHVLALIALALQTVRFRIDGVEWVLYGVASLELGPASGGLYYGAHLGAYFELAASPGPSYVAINVVAAGGLAVLLTSLRGSRRPPRGG